MSRLAELYKAIYQYILKNPIIAELTVEDPAEAFEDLRDKNDLEMLLSNGRFIEEGFGAQASVGGVRRARKSIHGGEQELKKGKLSPPADKPWAEKWRKDLKIAGVRLFLAGWRLFLTLFRSDNFRE